MAKLRWDCPAYGCFLIKKAPDLDRYDSFFKELIDRPIAFTDLDGICEERYNFVILEAKTEGTPLSEFGQTLLLKRLAESLKERMLIIFYWHKKSDKNHIVRIRTLFKGKEKDINFNGDGFEKIKQIIAWFLRGRFVEKNLR